MVYGDMSKGRKYLLGLQCKDCKLECKNRVEFKKHIREDHNFRPDWMDECLNDYCNKIYVVLDGGMYYKEYHTRVMKQGYWVTKKKIRVKKI